MGTPLHDSRGATAPQRPHDAMVSHTKGQRTRHRLVAIVTETPKLRPELPAAGEMGES